MEQSTSLLLSPYHWWILGALLIGLELLIPGVYIIWFGFSALILGVIHFFLPLTFTLQILLFAILSLIMALVGIRFYRKGQKDIHSGTLNLARGSEYIGETFQLEKAVTNGVGQLPIGDSVWIIKGPDLPAGSRIKITHIEGNSLHYEQTI